MHISRRIVCSIAAAVMVPSVALVMSGSTALAGTSGSHPLKDLPVFSSTRYDEWAGSGAPLSLETTSYNGNPALPVDTAQTYNNLPSLRVNVTSDGSSGYGWWSVTQADNNWETYALVSYYAHGALEFNIKGAAGGEAFTIGMGDRNYRRDPVQYNTPSIQSSNYVTVTTGWQHVRIPLTDLIPAGSVFDLNQVYLLYFGSANNNAQEFWLNDIEFTSPDQEHSAPFIKVNQLGYGTLATKYALVTGYADELSAADGTPFQVKRTADNGVVYSGRLKLAEDADTQSGERIFRADFTAVHRPGSYYLSVAAPGVADSLPFSIGSDVYQPLICRRDAVLLLPAPGNRARCRTRWGIHARSGTSPGRERALRVRSEPAPGRVAGLVRRRRLRQVRQLRCGGHFRPGASFKTRSPHPEDLQRGDGA